MSSWKKYGGTNSFEKGSDVKFNSIVTNYFTILKEITNDIDISGNIIATNRLDVYGDASFNQNLSVNGMVNMGKDLDVSGNVLIHNNGVIDGNLTVLNYLYFQDEPYDIYMYGDANGIAINKDIPEATVDICGNQPCILNVKSGIVETHNILARNVRDQGIMFSVDNSNTTIGFYHDNSMNINNLNTIPDAYLQYNEGGILHIDAIDHVQCVSNFIVEDISGNPVKDAMITVYNDLRTDTFLYDVYDVSSAHRGNGICCVAVDNSSTMFVDFVCKQNQLGGAIGGGAYPKNPEKGMVSIGTWNAGKTLYKPAQTVVSCDSNVVYKNTTGINKPIPLVDRYALDINGPTHLENREITTCADIPFQLNSMRFSKTHSNYGIAVGGVYKYIDEPTNSIFSQNAYVTTTQASSWYPSEFVTDSPNYNNHFMQTSWVQNDKYALVYGATGAGYCLDISNNVWYNKTMNTQRNGETDFAVTDIFTFDFSGNANNNTLATKVFFIMKSPTSGITQLRYFNAAFGANADYYANSNTLYDTKYVLYKNNNDIINDNLNIYYRVSITGNCIDGAGYIPDTSGNGAYIYVAGEMDIRKYFANAIDGFMELEDCAHNLPFSAMFNAVSVIDMSNVVAVGNGIVSYTKDGGHNWYDISQNTPGLTIENKILNSVCVYDLSNAIAVGDNGTMIYTTDGYVTWNDVPKLLLDLSGTGYPLRDASLNDIFVFNKNAFIVSSRVSQFQMDADLSNIGNAKIVYEYIPDLLNRENNSVLDLCGNMTIYGNIIFDKPDGHILSKYENLYFASDTPNVYIGDGTANNTYLGNSGGNVIVNGFLDINNNMRIDGSGGLVVVNGNINIPASHYLVSHGIDVSYANISVLGVTGGNAITRGTDLSYSFHVKGYRPAARIDASLSVDSLYVDSSAVMLGQMISKYNDVNPALYIETGTTLFCGNVDISNNSMLKITSNNDAVYNTSYGGLFLKDGTGAYFDGNVVMSRTLFIQGVGSTPLIVSSGISSFYNAAITNNLTVYGRTMLSKVVDISNNIDISANVNIRGSLTVNNINIPSDYRIKTNVVPISDTSFNVDEINPVYYYNTMSKQDQLGVLAHELQEKYPFLVNGVKDGPELQSVNYIGLVGLLVQEIKDLKRRVTELEKYTQTD
jgi:hypothetical protein